MSNAILVESVACTPDHALAATRAGARRIELVSAISEGGLTPSPGVLAEARRLCPTTPIVAMLRPRGGGFVYSDSEFAAIIRDVSSLGEADELIVGILTPTGHIDKARMGQVLEAAQGRPVACHRAFDQAADLFSALDDLIEIGIRRVLTSGGAASALAGSGVLRRLVVRAEGRIDILAGGRVRADNVREVIFASRVNQVHLGPFVAKADAWSTTSTHLALDAGQIARTVTNVSQ